ncbi:MAG: peptide chain release factor N(5)-glutamine methyltransferase [Flavobacteriaceae bacterium]|jgi:release factor glutamine methyltransferase|nr:peptide chain release factor N(5)-glutamine methyltransferase [Flavobacteriaceae bacterium]MBT4313371.1 peptide chain release factor N(5)-glutamine methyltransferase [Flavobacteriaceae bacterium]MBT5092410.1 peptide chain release factor N(5)-glutamine methyltransferase [Flavobacteriaceae bacterium]MBT5283235.1 peptide chain release factor N(5)-glutamine methyltransferase [Flavobacteriaceae bacterium]MBT5447095.1 peptide chain release factor N(5)-glutamine methyltransferase [Flavobacteriaceae|tara:strand:- start:24979 stop:25830 length:852 start_codon:yes stop_codon:yes gene_type:complete
MTYSEGRNIFREKLKSLFEVNEIDFYFKTVLQSIFNIEQTALALSPTKLFNENQKRELEKVLKQLLQEQPLQYIIGKAYFRSLTLTVNSSVLIPRPETEELVNWVLEDHQNLEEKQTLIDFGTGSGCIAIALAKEQPSFEVTAIDFYSSVLNLAKQNAIKNKTSVSFLQHDILQLNTLKLNVDIIVSNPPYIPPSEQREMKPNVLNYEPHLALFVPENDPLIFYRSILEYGLLYLVSDGLIYFEINPRFLSEMKSLILSFKVYSILERKDIFGKLRMLRVQKK